MKLRKCRREDELTWIQLNQEFMEFEIQDGGFWNNLQEDSHGRLSAVFQEALTQPEFITLFLLEVDGEIVGFANLMTIFSVWAGGKALILDDLFIRQDVQKKGYGRMAMEHLEGYAKEEGYKRFQFQSEFSNPGAYAFYRKLGYPCEDMRFYVKYF